ncbi:ABC transporter substrate-binding protein [Bacillus sp. V3B]|uniref:ABC transporter substrate-binding protein n=1 Tax=Bacillus sp. V3B TaxID=2804915 RepID=UPI00210EBD38|nr:ABC transporter substrate-binding protein [Bacillus sp. V3B]MCQ6277289.1 ABC transporter substrate-binding protein [Bacillus sp. V3B]
MKKLMSILSIFVLLLLTACGAEEEKDQQENATTESSGKPQLNIGYVSILANAPGIVADKQGYFAEKLDVQMYGFNSGPELFQALAAGELDVAYAGVPALVNWASRGLPVKVIAKVSDGKIGVVVGEESSITSVDELKGKVIAGVKSGSGVDLITRGEILPKARLSDKDLSIQEFQQANIEAALDSNQVQAGILNEPFLTYALLHGKKQIAEENDPALVVMASEEALQNKSEAVRTFMNIHQSTIQYLNENQEEANQVLVDVFNIGAVGDLPADQVMAKAREKMDFNWKFTNDNFTYYQQLADTANDLGYVKQEVDVKSLFDLSFVEGVIEE